MPINRARPLLGLEWQISALTIVLLQNIHTDQLHARIAPLVVMCHIYLIFVEVVNNLRILIFITAHDAEVDLQQRISFDAFGEYFDLVG